MSAEMYEYRYENKNIINSFTYLLRKTTASDLQDRFGLRIVILAGKFNRQFPQERKLSIRVKVNKDPWNLTKYSIKARV